jgi:tyrosyl-tRNA synthetase
LVVTSDEDAEKYIKIFTFADQETIDSLIEERQNCTLTVFTKTFRRRSYNLVHGNRNMKKTIAASILLATQLRMI